jgi:hypothetical protein
MTYYYNVYQVENWDLYKKDFLKKDFVLDELLKQLFLKNQNKSIQLIPIGTSSPKGNSIINSYKILFDDVILYLRMV